jgi:hypothetical protein
MSAPIAMYFGGSPLVFYMNDRAKNEWLAPGVTQPALMNIIANGLILNLAGNFVQRLSARGIVLMSLACLVNPALIAVSTYPGFETLQYLGAVVGAASFATALQFRPAVMQWWALDGRAAHGAAFIGFGLGLQYIAFALIMAWLLPSLGLANAMYCVAGIFAALETYPIWLAIRGELGSPGILPTRTSDIESAETVKGGGTEPFAAKLWSSKVFWQMWFHRAASTFVGFGMKALTTTIFHVVYDASFLRSTYFTVISLCLLVAANGIFPLLANRLPLLKLVTCLMIGSTILYALYPTIVLACPMWVLLIAQLLSTGSFAGMLTLQQQLNIQLFGASRLGTVSAALGSAQCIGFGLGPVFGHYVQILAADMNDDPTRSFNAWFYICSIVAAVDAINLVWMSLTFNSEGGRGGPGGQRTPKAEAQQQKQSIEGVCPPEARAEGHASP